jgi:hypothetical protein
VSLYEEEIQKIQNHNYQNASKVSECINYISDYLACDRQGEIARSNKICLVKLNLSFIFIVIIKWYDNWLKHEKVREIDDQIYEKNGNANVIRVELFINRLEFGQEE